MFFFGLFIGTQFCQQHAKSTNPFDNPSIDPHYFENDFGRFQSGGPKFLSDNILHSLDLEILVQHFKYIRTMAQTEPMKSGVVREVDPGPACVTDEDIRGLFSPSLLAPMLLISPCNRIHQEHFGVYMAWVSHMP